ncbi:hypothetical protein VPNG_02310 [Cytospora leucostoma]|uniref:Uncharacterized protein n=1 Tax=Cytospora leucostoma TaxID=1230097 RepID=A0A423XH75_9PEZI|nr:hypothetical protein VPNG_02310 [Cytospora leucostoma]
MASDDSLPTLKILLIGPSGAGKSALLTRYCEDVFEPESATATIGIDFKRWFDEVEMNTVPGVALYLVGTKIDRPRAVPTEEGRALALAHGAGFCEVSAKTSDNVREPFVEVVDLAVADPALLREADRGREGTVSVDGAAGGGGCSC